jgi:hypothetical protein
MSFSVRGLRTLFSACDAASMSPDLRSLALFRLGLGVCIFLDAIDRSMVEDLYALDGPTPLAAVEAALGPPTLTHLGSADHGVVKATLVAEAFAGLLVAVGAPLLRLWLGLALAIVISWGERNPFASFAGDEVLMVCLWWSLGLPLRGALTLTTPRVDVRSRFAACGILP